MKRSAFDAVYACPDLEGRWPPRTITAIVVVDALTPNTRAALEHARRLSPARLLAVHLAGHPSRTGRLRGQWDRLVMPDVPLVVIDGAGDLEDMLNMVVNTELALSPRPIVLLAPYPQEIWSRRRRAHHRIALQFEDVADVDVVFVGMADDPSVWPLI